MDFFSHIIFNYKLVLLDNILDFTIWFCHFAISFLAFFFVYKKGKMIPFRHMFLMFTIFILFCGSGYLVEIIVDHYSLSNFSSFWKSVVAIISIVTMLAFVCAIPKISRFMESFFHLLGLIPDGIIVTNYLGKIVMSNELGAKIFSYEIKDIENKSIDIVMPELFSSFMNNTSKLPIEIMGISKNNIPMWIEVAHSEISLGSEIFYIFVIRNIHERKKAEEKLQKSETRFREMFNKSSTGISLADKKGNILEVNPFFAQMIGYKPEELQNINYMAITHPEDKLLSQQQYNKFVSKKDTYQLEKRYIHKNGSTVYTEITVSTFTNDDIINIAMINDITQRKKNVMELRKSEARFRQVFEKSAVGIAIVNDQMVCREVNPAFQNMLGYSKHEFAAMIFTDFTHPEDIPKDVTLYEELLNEKRTNYFIEKRYIHKNGSIIWAELSVSLFPDDYEHNLYLSIIRDITDYKQVQEELIQHKDHLQVLVEERTKELVQEQSILKALLDSIPDLIFYKNKEKLYVGCNKAFTKYFGKNKFDIVNKTDEQIFSDNFCELSENEEMVLTKRREIKKEESLVNSKQQKFLFETLKAPYYDSHGKLMGLIGISRDITERKQQEKNLQEAIKNAEKANITKSTFLANMSHEIRTPMNGIMGFIEFLLRTSLSYEQYNYMAKMKRVSRSLLAMLNDILDFSKLEAGKLFIEETSFYLDDTIEEIISQFSKISFEKGLDLIIDLPPDVPISLIGDPLRVRQILINLVGNAIKFTEVGEVTVTIRKRKENKKNFILIIVVKDSGIGIPEEKLENLFTPFSQVDNSNTRKYGGTGLGLSISFELVSLMKGKISVRSTVKKGTEFFVEIPMKKQQKTTRRSLRRDNMADHRALIIDNHKKHQHLVVRMMRYFGFFTDSLSDLDSLSNFVDKKYDVILCSWTLADKTGYEIISHIKSYPTLRDVSIVAFGNVTETQELENLEKQGLSSFLTKPIGMSMLFDTMVSILGKSVATKYTSNEIWYRKESKLLSNIKILLVEDNEINQEVARELLQTVGIKVAIANHGKEALTILEKEKFDIVLMDIQMPEMDGYQTAQTIRKNLCYKKLPIIAMTACAMSGDKEKCLQAGMDDYLTKPIDPEYLFSTILKWVITEQENSDIAHLKTKELSVQKTQKLTLSSMKKVDSREFLQRLGGNEHLLCELLGKFVANYSNINSDIQKSLSALDYENALKIIHTLKGVSGNISAKDLEKITKELESQIKGKSDFQKTLTAFDFEFKETIKTIQQFLIENKQTQIDNHQITSPDNNKEKLSVLLEELEFSLNKFIPKKCQELINQIKSICDETWLDNLVELEGFVKKYKAKEAKALFAEMLEKI